MRCHSSWVHRRKSICRLSSRASPAPVLNAINNADGDGNYTVSWNAVVGATSYTLEEDDNATFTSPTTQYNAAGTSWNAAGKAVATYYYRVKASNSYGSSGWSNVQTATVSPVCQNTIQNSGFENGTTNWQEFSTHGWDIIISSGFPATCASTWWELGGLGGRRRQRYLLCPTDRQCLVPVSGLLALDRI